MSRWLLLSFLLGVVSTEDCPRSWWPYAGHCYHTHRAHTWYEADEKCREMGAHLVSLHSMEEMDYLVKESKKNWFLEDLVWTGLNNLNGSLEWSDGTAVDFRSWGRDGDARDLCVSWRMKEYTWSLANCGLQLAFFCKKPVESSSRPLPPRLTPPPVTGRCPPNWFQYGSKCFQVQNEAKTWDDGKQMCRAKGSAIDLASLHSRQELELVLSLLWDTRPNAIWIGLRKFDYNFGTASWSDNSRVDFTNWAKGHPKPLWDPCVQMSAKGLEAGLWQSANCSLSRPYVCQQPVDPTQPPAPKDPSCAPLPHFPKALRQDDTCLRLSSRILSWQEAKDDCLAIGSHLVALEHPYMEGALFGLVNSSENVWLGLFKEKGSFLLQWEDGTDLSFSRWRQSQPQPGAGPACVARDSVGWSVQPCSITLRYVCAERDDRQVVKRPVNPRKCPSHRSDWIDVGNEECYLLSQKSRIWGDASLDCFIQGGTLATARDERQMKALQTYLSCPECPRSIWLGGYMDYAGTWRWFDGTSLGPYLNWKKGEPDSRPWIGGNRRCVLQDSLDGGWSNEGCGTMAGFFCAVPKTG